MRSEPLATREFVLGEQSWDDGLAALTGRVRRRRCSVRSPTAETTLTVTFEEGFDCAQVYAPPGHDYICFEPMTAPTDALNSGQGLVRGGARARSTGRAGRSPSRRDGHGGPGIERLGGGIEPVREALGPAVAAPCSAVRSAASQSASLLSGIGRDSR